MGDAVYIRTDTHERMIRRGHDPKEYVNRVVKEALDREEAEGEKVQHGAQGVEGAG